MREVYNMMSAGKPVPKNFAVLWLCDTMIQTDGSQYTFPIQGILRNVCPYLPNMAL